MYKLCLFMYDISYGRWNNMAVATQDKQERVKAKEQRNFYVRKRFLKYYKDNYEPKCRLIAEHVGLGYMNFKRFTINNHDYGNKSLDKIEKFLQEQGY